MKTFLIILLLAFITGCSEDQSNNSIGRNSPNELKLDKVLKLKGRLSGKKFSHRVFYHPPYTKIAHFDLSSNESLYKKSKHLVIYFKKDVDTDEIYKKFLDKDAVLKGKLYQVDGIFLKADKNLIKQRKAHTLYYLTVNSLEFESK